MNDRTVIRPGGRRPNSNNNNEDRTVVRPGGSQRGRTPVQGSQPARYKTDLGIPSSPRHNPNVNRQMHANVQHSEVSIENNQLLDLVSPLIALVSRISSARESIDVDELRHQAIEQMESFYQYGFGLNGDQEQIRKASYGLCCLLDELVLNTPWGSQSAWATESLLVTYHQEAWGGENFFIYLDELSSNPSLNYHILELYYVALDMGFEGRYRQIPNGHRDLDAKSKELYSILLRFRPASQSGLSPHWRGLNEQKNSLLKVIPQWVVWSVASGIAILSFIGMSVLLSNQADPIQRKLASLTSDGALEVIPRNLSQLGRPSFQTVVEPDLVEEKVDYYTIVSNTLSKDISDRSVQVEKADKGTLVRLIGSDLFRSGSDAIAPEYGDIVRKLGASLIDHRVQIEVTGHTDNVPIRTLRFANNWALSSARAEIVKQILLPTLHENSRVMARGLADTQSIVPNDSDFNRAKNRRVEILIHD